MCRVKTWLARRLVSLPFSDHCDPLIDRPEDLEAMLEYLAGEMERGRWRSLELRPRPGAWPEAAGQTESAKFCLHTLDLARPEEQIFRGFHASSTQRAIRRAEREGLSYEAGTSDRLLSAFYRLLRLTRRRHGLPPQPMAWFRNLIACIPSTLRQAQGRPEQGRRATRFARSGQGATIHVASKDGVPVAGILTLTFKNSMVYKYGGSDAAYHSLGGMPFLFWRAIQAAKALGVEELDLGRSDLDQPGLIAFKEHLGGVRSDLTYYGHPERRADAGGHGPAARVAGMAVRHLPDAAWTSPADYSTDTSARRFPMEVEASAST